jgi:Glycosyl hydrolases family 38 C-terminal beta sandwich domain
MYLINNMFDINVRCDQPGPARFAYALRSHDGDWRQGKADEFGWDTMNPLVAVPVHGKNPGPLPAAGSFVSVSPSSVVCTTLKPAEANGAGFIVRLVETRGQETTATVALPFLAPLASATVTNLVEDDRPEPLAIEEGTRFTIPLRPFAVRTVRVTCRPGSAPAVPALTARAVADMEVALSWQAPAAAGRVSHYHVYRGMQPHFAPGLLNLVERPAGTSFHDHPQLHHGGWINNRLEPATTYYYRVAAVDRWNNVGPASPAVAATTLKSSEKNLLPRPVECLRAVLVSPLSRFNAVNLLWRTGCESDIGHYEVHRSTTAGFQPQAGTRIAVVDTDAVLGEAASTGRRRSPIACASSTTRCCSTRSCNRRRPTSTAWRLWTPPGKRGRSPTRSR